MSDWSVTMDIGFLLNNFVKSFVVTTVLWTFDNTFNDQTGQFTGTGLNSPTFASGIKAPPPQKKSIFAKKFEIEIN